MNNGGVCGADDPNSCAVTVGFVVLRIRIVVPMIGVCNGGVVVPRIRIIVPMMQLDSDRAVNVSNGGVFRRCGRGVCSAEDPNHCADDANRHGLGCWCE